LESPVFATVVAAGNILGDVFIHHVENDITVTIGTEITLSIGYFIVSIVLRDVFHFSIKQIKFDNILTLVAVLPAAAAFSMTLYCGLLYIFHAIPVNLLSAAAYQFWLGDTVGMIVVIPATIAIYDIVVNTKWRSGLKHKDCALLAIVVICLGAFTFISTSRTENHHLFYLLFLPIIWISIKYGYIGASLLLLVTQIFVIAALTYFRVDDDQFSVFQTLMFILSATGLLLGVVVTERDGAERLLRDQRAELARLGSKAAASAMASTVAHEISQPLSAMSIYVHSACLLLDRGPKPPSVVEARAALADAEAQARRTRAIIERIRDFVAGGKLELETLDFAQIIQKICKLNAEEARDRGVSVSVEARAPVPAARADRIAIEQALNNLVTNAIDSAAERRDGAGRVVIRLSRRDACVVIDVDDNGPGVANEVADKLFETFETTKPSGMGLGLPLAREVARRHSGHLNWRPLEPQGAQFSIELPILEPE
jgi:signal transduction histidine kinase